MPSSSFFERWFLTGIGHRSSAFLRGLHYALSSTVVTRIVSGVATLLAARLMGPSEFGKANVALAAALYIQVPLFLGLPTALMHYTPQAPEREKPHWISEGLRLSVAVGLVTLVVAYGTAGWWTSDKGLTPRMYEMALIWCAGFLVFTISNSVMTAREAFRSRALSEVAFAALFAVFVAAAWRWGLSGTKYVAALALAYGFVGLAGLLMQSRDAWLDRPNAARVKRLLSYGLIASLGSVVSALLQSSSRLVAYRHLSLPEVGVLSAYHGGSVQMALTFLGAGVQVFFPIASRTPDKKMLFRKLHRFSLLLFPFAFVTLTGVLALYLLLLGGRYPTNLKWILAFAATAVLSAYHGILGWALASLGRRGVLVSTGIGLVSGLINMALCEALIPRHSLLGAAYALGAASLTGIALTFIPSLQRRAGIVTR
jgi:O-antigen/teichoic acid export membrane protein